MPGLKEHGNHGNHTHVLHAENPINQHKSNEEKCDYGSSILQRTQKILQMDGPQLGHKTK